MIFTAPLAANNASESRRRVQWAFAAIMGIGITLRLATLWSPYSYFPDEIFQYLDVAHKHAFGQGVVTWEQREGIRSPLFPLLLSAGMRIGDWWSPFGDAYLLVPKIMLALASLGVIWGSFVIGRLSSPTHGLFAAFVAAIWFEFVYFSTQALTETFAVSFFFMAAGLLFDARDRRQRLFAGGFCLALAALLRIQYAPCLILFGTLLCGKNSLYWKWTSLGAATATAMSALIDLFDGRLPFSWAYAYFFQNIVIDRASQYGVSEPYYLVAATMVALMPFGVPIIALAILTGRRFPILGLTCLSNYAVHSLIGHKEYRFVLLSTAILVILAAIGSVDLLKKREDGKVAPVLLSGLAGLWLLASVICGTNSFNLPSWSRLSAELKAFRFIGKTQEPCGLLLLGESWTRQGAYSYLHRPVPIYALNEAAAKLQLSSASPSFNVVMTSPALAKYLPRQFELAQCFHTPREPGLVCVYRRSGTCSPQAGKDFEINTMLRRNKV